MVHSLILDPTWLTLCACQRANIESFIWGKNKWHTVDSCCTIFCKCGFTIGKKVKRTRRKQWYCSADHIFLLLITALCMPFDLKMSECYKAEAVVLVSLYCVSTATDMLASYEICLCLTLLRIFSSKAIDDQSFSASNVHSLFPCCSVQLPARQRRLKRGKAGRSDTGPCMLRWSRITSWQMVCRLITCSTHPIARDEAVLTVSNALPRGPYHPPLLACLPPLFLLMLSIWRFMQKCAASRPPWSPSILSVGTPACQKLSYAEIVKLRLLASCLTKAFLSVHFKQGWCL